MTPVQVYALAGPWLQDGRRRRQAPAADPVERVEAAAPGDVSALAMLSKMPYGGGAR